MHGRDQDALLRYANGGHHKVVGWLNPISARFIASLAQYQAEKGYRGSAGEVGVHHGRLFILLHLANREARSFAIDLFEDQSQNVDRSGRGDLEIFRRNVARETGRLAEVEIISKSSLTVRPEEIVDSCGRARLFSVDGGHTAECTRNDLALADAVLTDEGVVILDDYFNQLWPDVSVGANDHLRSSECRLAPFAITPNKLYFCRPDYSAEYSAAMDERWKTYRDASNMMFGRRVNTYGVNLTRGGRRARLRQVVRNSPLLMKLYRRVSGRSSKTP